MILLQTQLSLNPWNAMILHQQHYLSIHPHNAMILFQLQYLSIYPCSAMQKFYFNSAISQTMQWFYCNSTISINQCNDSTSNFTISPYLYLNISLISPKFVFSIIFFIKARISLFKFYSTFNYNFCLLFMIEFHNITWRKSSSLRDDVSFVF